MSGRYRRRRYVTKKNKWNLESRCEDSPALTVQPGNQGQNCWYISGTKAYFWNYLVENTTVPGTRKVKNIQLSMRLNSPMKSVFYAVVYVPEGTMPTVPRITSEGYQPSQYVLMQGMLTDLQPVNKFSRLARNLNAGDSIALIFWADSALNVDSNNVQHPTAGEQYDVSAYTQYAICYN